jgi:hypothetical protein
LAGSKKTFAEKQLVVAQNSFPATFLGYAGVQFEGFLVWVSVLFVPCRSE